MRGTHVEVEFSQRTGRGSGKNMSSLDDWVEYLGNSDDRPPIHLMVPR